MTAKEIIDAIGLSAIADAAGVASNTVHYWKRRRIPPDYWHAVATLAATRPDTTHITLDVIRASSSRKASP